MLELAALLTAIKATRDVVREGIGFVQDIRSGISARNDKIKEDLTAKLTGIEERLKDIGQVAEVVESYLRTFDNIRDLLATSQELLQFIKDSDSDLATSRSTGYAKNWDRVAIMYRRLGEESEAPQKVMLDRAGWYDERDKIQIEGKLKEFTGAYARAKGYVEGRRADGVKSELEQMIRPLSEAQLLLSSSLYDQILPSLQQLNA